MIDAADAQERAERAAGEQARRQAGEEAAETAEPPEQGELEHATSLPSYGWFDAPALRKEMLEPDPFRVGRRAGK